MNCHRTGTHNLFPGIFGLLLSLSLYCSYSNSNFSGSEVESEDVVACRGKIVAANNLLVDNVIVRSSRYGFADTTDYSGVFDLRVTRAQAKILGIVQENYLDTLLFIKTGSQLKTYAVNKAFDTTIVIALYQLNFYGTLLSADTAIARGEAVLWKVDSPDEPPRHIKIGLAVAAKQFSGYVVLPPYTTECKLGAYINFLTGNNVLCGQSDTIIFSSNMSYVEFGKIDPFNRRPLVKAVKDTTVTSNDTVHLNCTAYAFNGATIVKYEWKIYTDSFVETPGPEKMVTVPVCTSSTDISAPCIIRVTDSHGLRNQDTMIVTIVPDIPVAFAGNDTSVCMKTEISLRGRAEQNFGKINKWEWKIGENNFTVCSTGVITWLTAAHYRYRMPCILRVTDDDGFVGIDTVYLTTGNWERIGNATNNPFLKGNSLYKGDYYAAYVDSIDRQSFIVHYRGDGVWEDITPKLKKSPGTTIYGSLVASKTYLYCTAYDKSPEVTGTDRLSVLRYDQTKWTELADLSIPIQNPADLRTSPIVSVDGEVPYIALYTKDSEDSLKCYVKKYADDGWVDMTKSLSFDEGFAFSVSQGVLYIAFLDFPLNDKISIRRYTNNSWEFIGKKLADCHIKGISLLVNNGMPYLAFWSREANTLFAGYYNGLTWIVIASGALDEVKQCFYTGTTWYDNHFCVAYNNKVAYWEGAAWHWIDTSPMTSCKNVNQISIIGQDNMLYYCFVDLYVNKAGYVNRLK